MAYVAPHIDDSGCHTNSYADIIEYIVDQVKTIYGPDIYLEPDSMDYQFLSIFARAIYEEEQCAQMSYQARSPITASTRDAMDSLVTMNGLLPKKASYSTVALTLTGIPYTLINGGVVQSTSGDKWNLPQTVTIGSSGTVTAIATAQELGSIEAPVNTVTKIITPTYGWTSVTNLSSASVGQPIETLSELKVRQQRAVATPAQTPKESIISALYDIEGVTNLVIYENDTSAADTYDTEAKTGGPANSITCVIEGGSNLEIANAINRRKTPGCYTEGDVEVNAYDSYNNPTAIRFYRPDITQVYATFTLTALPGYSSAVGDKLKEAVSNYVDQIGIGDNLYLSQLWEAALSVSPDIKPYFSLRSVTQGTTHGSESTSDLTASFDTKYSLPVANITLVVS